MNRKILIVAWAPIPTPRYQKVDGISQRFLGLAQGLSQNGINEITIAVHESYPLDVDEIYGFDLFNYSLDETFANKLKEYSTIILNYINAGSDFVIENSQLHQQIIIDAYGPIYVEALAREPKNVVEAYHNNRWTFDNVYNKIMKRGDYYLIANDNQSMLYTGVLTALGAINQYTYNIDQLIKVPFGIDRPKNIEYINPYLDIGIAADDFIILWFGGIYPWFDVTFILRTIAKMDKKVKLVIVGGKNHSNDDVNFSRNYNKAVTFVAQNDLSNRVKFVDWVDYETRQKYYDYASIIISINKDGKENIYSWRTRVMDYLNSSTPIITNSGDPLSDELIQSNAAFEAGDIEYTLNNIIENPDLLTECSHNMSKISQKYYWEVVTRELAEIILEQRLIRQDESVFVANNESTIYRGDDEKNTNNKVRTLLRVIKTRGLSGVLRVVRDKLE